jgi:rare lipoprotein A
MTYRLRSGLTALLCFTAIGLTTKPGTAQESSLQLAPQPQLAPWLEATKLGEIRTDRPRPSDTIAKIHTHQISGKPAATLYVRNLPILTFLGEQSAAPNSATLNNVLTNGDVTPGDVKVGTQATAKNDSSAVQLVSNFATAAKQPSSQANPADSMTRAAQIAAKLNQMYRDGIAADQIQVVWQAEKNANVGQYVVQVENLPIAAINASTTYAETTRNAEQDALLVANRLRRLMGDANPIKSVKGKPQSVATQPAIAGDAEWSVRQVIRGEASWYGPGFDGNLTANGETFNQNALTAAHPSLAFGTRIRVTNQYNGRSVVVRINDRGPYAGGRIVDLSAGAAGVIGLDVSGVAPVTLEVLQRNDAIAAGSR